jgi:hypothetical protein
VQEEAGDRATNSASSIPATDHSSSNAEHQLAVQVAAFSSAASAAAAFTSPLLLSCLPPPPADAATPDAEITENAQGIGHTVQLSGAQVRGYIDVSHSDSEEEKGESGDSEEMPHGRLEGAGGQKRPASAVKQESILAERSKRARVPCPSPPHLAPADLPSRVSALRRALPECTGDLPYSHVCYVLGTVDAWANKLVASIAEWDTHRAKEKEREQQGEGIE